MYRPRTMRMTLRRRSWRPLAALASAAAVAALVACSRPGRQAAGDTPPPATSAADQPDESLLGTIEVNGSAGLPPLPKMGVVPIVPTGSADSLVNLVVRRDMELSGQFDVLDEDTSPPPGPFTHTTPMDLGGWRDKGAEYVLRVFAQPAADRLGEDGARRRGVPDADGRAGRGAEGAHVADSFGSVPDVKPAFRGDRRHRDDRGPRGVAPPGRPRPRRADRAARAASRAR